MAESSGGIATTLPISALGLLAHEGLTPTTDLLYDDYDDPSWIFEASTYTFSSLGDEWEYPNVDAGMGPRESLNGNLKVSPFLLPMGIGYGYNPSAHGFSSSMATRPRMHWVLAQNQEHSLNLEDAFDMESTASPFKKIATSTPLFYENSFRRLPEVRAHNIVFHMARLSHRGKNQESFLDANFRTEEDKKKDLLLYLPYIVELIRLHGLCETDSTRRIFPETFHHQDHISHEVDSTNIKANSMILNSKMGTDLSAHCFRIRHRARLRAAQWHTNLP